MVLHGKMNHHVSPCVGFMREVLANQTSIDSPTANYYSAQMHFWGQVNSGRRGRGLGVCVCVWGIEGGGHHVIIWHLQCPTLQICEDGEQKICLLWSPVPHSLLCGWSLWIIHREGAIGICDGKSVGEYHTIDGILHYVSCALRAHRPHIM